MGCANSKAIEEPRVITGGVSISHGANVVIIGKDLLIPLTDETKNETSVIKIDLKRKKYEIIKGFNGYMYKNMTKSCENGVIEETIDS